MIVKTKKQLKELVCELQKNSAFAIDTETTSLDIMLLELLGISFYANGKSYYVPVNGELLVSEIILELKPVLEDDKIGKILHNAKFDMNVLRNYNVNLKGVIFDTIVAHWLLNENSAHALDKLSKRYLREDISGYAEKINIKKMGEVKLEDIAKYSEKDAEVTWRLYEIFLPQLQKEKLYDEFMRIEMKLIPVLVEMERKGISLESGYLEKVGDDLGEKICILEKEIKKEVGKDFNIGSPMQLGKVLFEDMGIESVEKTKTGRYATGEKILGDLSKGYPIVKKILKYRGMKKLLSTFVIGLLDKVSSDGRVHTHFNNIRTVTGRLSSDSPNMQQIPVKDTSLIRKAFFAPKGKFFIVGDYSQVELRLIAHLADDKVLIKSFKNGDDVHRRTASEIFDIPIGKVTPEERNRGKTFNFAIMYGSGAWSLSKALDIDIRDAQTYLRRYFRTYEGARKFIERTREGCEKFGFVRTIVGRKRRLPMIKSKIRKEKGYALRQSVNSVVQGSGGDVIKLAMIKIFENKRLKELNVDMLLSVHDELVFECPEKSVKEAVPIIKDLMEHPFKKELRVPLDVDIRIVGNWALAK